MAVVGRTRPAAPAAKTTTPLTRRRPVQLKLVEEPAEEVRRQRPRARPPLPQAERQEERLFATPAEPVRIIGPEPTEEDRKAQNTAYSWSERVDYDRIINDYKDGVNSYKTAIRSHCVECMGGLVQSIKGCTSMGCSLYPFRMGENPFDERTKKAKTKKGEAVPTKPTRRTRK